MAREKIEKLGSLFITVFSTGLALQLASAGMEPRQWPGAAVAVAGSLALAFTVRAWPDPKTAPAAARRVRED